MQSHMQSQEACHQNLYELAGYLIYLIDQKLVYRTLHRYDPHGIRLMAVLNKLNDFRLQGTPTLTIYDFLWINNGGGWCFAQMLGGIKNKHLIERYLDLLEDLLLDGVSAKQIFLLLIQQDDKGLHLALEMGISNKFHFLKLLSKCCARGVEKEEIQQLLSLPDKQGQSFLKDLAEKFQLSKNKIKHKRYSDLTYGFIKADFIPEEAYTFFAKSKTDLYTSILEHIATRSQDEQVQILKNALDPTHRLGKFFWRKRGYTQPSIQKGTLYKIAEMLQRLEHPEASDEEGAKKSLSRKQSWIEFFNKQIEARGMGAQEDLEELAVKPT